jgi:hypothetical protein
MKSIIVKLIWLYVILLIVEGAFRKWWLPSLANPLLIVRDPVLIAIYILAFIQGVFPTNGWIMATVGFAVWFRRRLRLGIRARRPG